MPEQQHLSLLIQLGLLGHVFPPNIYTYIQRVPLVPGLAALNSNCMFAEPPVAIGIAAQFQFVLVDHLIALLFLGS